MGSGQPCLRELGRLHVRRHHAGQGQGSGGTVAKELYASDEELQDGVDTQTIFPLNQKMLASDAFADTPVKFFSGQTANKDVYIPAENAYEGYTYSPFTTYYYSELTKAMVSIIDGSKSGSEALDDLQGTMTDYAKAQGFTVK